MTEYHSRAFDLTPNGDYMRYEYHHGEVIDYLTADETLFKILTQCGLSPFLDDGRIRFTDSHDNDKYRIGDLAFACYNVSAKQSPVSRKTPQLRHESWGAIIWSCLRTAAIHAFFGATEVPD